MVPRATAFALLLAAGCGHHHHHFHPFGEIPRPTPLEAVAVGATTLAAVAIDEAGEPPTPAPPRPLARPLVGKVLLADTRGEVPGVRVTLHDPHDLVVLEAVTDERGWFRFPMPLPPSWYVLSVDDEAGRGSTRVWLHDRRPGHLDVLVS